MPADPSPWKDVPRRLWRWRRFLGSLLEILRGIDGRFSFGLLGGGFAGVGRGGLGGVRGGRFRLFFRRRGRKDGVGSEDGDLGGGGQLDLRLALVDGDGPLDGEARA